METVGQQDLEKIDGLVVRLVGHALMAKAYKEEIRRNPALGAGFGRLADKHAAAATAMCDEIRGATTALMGMGVVAAPFTAPRRERVR